MKPLLAAGLALAFSAPALAQQGHAGHGAPPAAAPTPPEPAPQPQPGDPHAGHDMGAMPQASGAEIGAIGAIGNAPAPAPPEDHAADAYFDPTEMAQARAALRRENGAFNGSMILFDLAEYQARKGGDGYRWEGEAWFGGDIDRFLVKTEGEGTFGEPLDDAELQLLYSRAVAPNWNVHAGLRHDFRPDPSRTYAVVGIEGIAPYWFHLSGQVFLSDRGDFRARAEASYDQRFTQHLILSPRAEVNFSAQDLPASGIGTGLTDLELGLRLRYELRKEFAPYIGVEWASKLSGTARYARAAGEDASATNLVAGIRFWF